MVRNVCPEKITNSELTPLIICSDNNRPPCTYTSLSDACESIMINYDDWIDNHDVK